MKKEHIEIILEDISSKFDLVLEGHENLHSEIRELSRKTDERFDLVDLKIDTLNKKIDSVEEKLSKKSMPLTINLVIRSMLLQLISRRIDKTLKRTGMCIELKKGS